MTKPVTHQITPDAWENHPEREKWDSTMASLRTSLGDEEYEAFQLRLIEENEEFLRRTCPEHPALALLDEARANAKWRG